MNKLLHSLVFWLVMFLVGSGLLMGLLLSYLMRWYQSNPGYLDVMASAVIVVLIIPFFLIAAYFVLRAATSDLPTYAQLGLSELLSKLPRITFDAPVVSKSGK